MVTLTEGQSAGQPPSLRQQGEAPHSGREAPHNDNRLDLPAAGFCDDDMNANNANLIYCLQFLRNGGERMRAIRLAADVLEWGVKDARDYVDGLHTPIPVDVYEKPKVICKSCRTAFDHDDQRLIVGLCPVCAEML